MNIGEKIKQLRNQKGLSTYDLSKLTGISQSTISKLENNKRKADFDIIQKIANALKVNVEDIFKDEIGLAYKAKEDEPEFMGKSYVPDDPYIDNLQNLINNYTKEDIEEAMKIVKKYPELIDKSKHYTDEEILILANKIVFGEREEKYKKLIDSLEKKENPSYNFSDITDVKKAMDIIMSQPGLMLNGEMLSDESKIALANAINMGLAYAQQMQEKEKKKAKEK